MERTSRGSLTLGWRSIIRRLRSEPSVVLSIAITALLAAFLVAAAPRWLEVVSDDDLRSTLVEPEPAQRNLRVERQGRIGAGPPGDPFRSVDDAGDAFARSEFPPSVAAITPDHYFLVDSPRFEISPLPGEEAPHPFPTFLRYRYQEGIEDRTTVVRGSLPRPREPVPSLVGQGCPEDPTERAALLERNAAGELPDVPDCFVVELPHYEVAVSEETAIAMGLDVGDRAVLTPDPTDPLFFGIAGSDLAYQAVMSISGIVELSSLEEEYWYGDPALHQPAIRENADLRVIYATGLMSPDDYGAMLATTGEAGRSYVWRHLVIPDLVLEQDLTVLQDELHALELDYSPVAAAPTQYRVVTQLDDLLAAHEAQESQTLGLLSLAVAGMLGVVVTVLVALGALMARRRRGSTTLVRGRGAGRGQLLLTALYEGLLLLVPAALLGYLAATLGFPATSSELSYRLTVALIATAVIALVLAGLSPVVTPLGNLRSARAGRVLPKPSTRRAVVEVLVVVVAIGSVLLLRRRGQSGDPAGKGLDLLLAVSPVLVALAIALILVRLFPYLIRFMAWLASVGRGAVAFVGLRRVERIDFASHLPLIAIVICIATATYSATVGESMAAGQVASSWQEVGGDFAIEGFAPDANLPTAIDMETIGPHDAVALGKHLQDPLVVTESGRTPAAALAIDAPAYTTVTAGTAGAVDLPPFMFATPGDDIGTESEPIPVIASRDWPSAIDIQPGQVFTLNLGSDRLEVVAREVRDRYPDIEPGRPFVVMSMAAFAAATDSPTLPTVAYLRGGEEYQEELRLGLAEQAPSARLISRYEVLAGVADDPFVAWARVGLDLVFWFSAAFALVAAITSLAMTTAERRRDLAYLGTAGLDSGQALGVTLFEHLPTVSIGVVAGIGAGAIGAIALDAAIDLSGFTGGLIPAEIEFDWPSAAILALGSIAALSLSVILFTLANRRRDTTAILRAGDEP